MRSITNPAVLLVLTAASCFVPNSTAHSAEMPPKAPVYKAPVYKVPARQVYDWTGLYVGVNAGGSVGRSRTHTNDPGAGNENETTFLSPIGAIGGGQIGYNWQIPGSNNFVVGLEADIQASGQRGSACIANCFLDGSVSLHLQQKVDWFGTARFRAGWATGPVLNYITAGFAYGHVNTSGSLVEFSLPGSSFALDSTRSGFVVGSGVEASLGGNWTAKIEYLYVDLGQSTTVVTGLSTNQPIFGNPVTVSTQVRDIIYRGGINYRFDGRNTRVAPVANWGGFYVGGNGGSITARNPSTYEFGPEQNALPPNHQSFTLMPQGYFGGVQAGYNWQAGAVVLGVEADIQGTTAKDNVTCILACTVATGTTAYDQKVTYFGTVRGRIGYSVGATLFYATAGYAYGETTTAITSLGQPILSQMSSFKHSKGGYAAGGGIESPLQLFDLFGPNWTAKTEYLYVDLGRSTDTLAPFGSTDTFTTRTQAHIFRSGVNYHFDAPVVAR